MATDLIHDRGRGPEIVGTRITVYNLLPHFMDAAMNEETICRLYELTAEQVAAARAYVLNNPDTVLARHLKIEERMAAGNSREVVERAKETHAAFLSFKEWLTKHEEAIKRERASEVTLGTGRTNSSQLPTFQEYLAQKKSRPAEGS